MRACDMDAVTRRRHEQRHFRPPVYDHARMIEK
jgi:hypothetical protein